MEYADLLEKEEPDSVCGLQESHRALSWPGGGGGVPGALGGLFYVEGDHPLAVSGTASAGADRGHRQMVLGAVQRLEEI